MPKGDRFKLKADPEDGAGLATSQDLYKERLSWRYKKWQSDVRGGCCAYCGHGYTNTLGVNLETHHIYAFAKYPQLRYDPNNGLVLCHDCHKETETYGYKQRWAIAK